MIATDILTDDNGELRIANGDFVVGASDDQHMQHMLWANQGSYKQSPKMGIGIFSMLNNSRGAADMNALRKRIVINAAADGMIINKLDLGDLTNMEIDVSR